MKQDMLCSCFRKVILATVQGGWGAREERWGAISEHWGEAATGDGVEKERSV